MVKVDPHSLVVHDSAIDLLPETHPKACCAQATLGQIPISAFDKGVDTQQITVVIGTHILNYGRCKRSAGGKHGEL
jgi:hypothetical protein